MGNLKIEPILCRAGSMDNYAWLLIDEESGQSAVVDPSEAAPIINRCQELNVKPDYKIGRASCRERVCQYV